MKNQNGGVISDFFEILLIAVVFVGVLILNILPYALLLGACAFAIYAGIALGKKFFGESNVATKLSDGKEQDVEVSKKKEEDLDKTIINYKVKQNDLVKENANSSDEI